MSHTQNVTNKTGWAIEDIAIATAVEAYPNGNRPSDLEIINNLFDTFKGCHMRSEIEQKCKFIERILMIYENDEEMMNYIIEKKIYKFSTPTLISIGIVLSRVERDLKEQELWASKDADKIFDARGLAPDDDRRNWMRPFIEERFNEDIFIIHESWRDLKKEILNTENTDDSIAYTCDGYFKLGPKWDLFRLPEKIESKEG